jgi:tetratricopeptide (TPR) repeat protein
MKVLFLAGAVFLVTGIAQAQTFDPGTPDGAMVISIQKEPDATKKQGMLEDFTQKFPDSKLAGWAWAQLQTGYLQAQNYDKTIEAGEKSLAKDPDNTEVAYNNLKAAEAKNDPDAVLKWSGVTSEAARKEVASAKPGGDQSRVDYAKQVDTYTEYSDYAAALKTTDPAKVIALVESLEQRNPNSPYLSKAYGLYLNTLRNTKQNDKVGAAAIRELQRDPTNEDALLAAAQHSMEQKDTDKALQYATKLTQSMQAKPKPEDMADADWQKKKQKLLAVGFWLQGTAYNTQSRYSDADKALRQALPLVKNDTGLLPMVLFQLGAADFQLGKSSKSSAMMKEALSYSKQSAALSSPVQVEAQNNVKAITRALGGPAH